MRARVAQTLAMAPGTKASSPGLLSFMSPTAKPLRRWDSMPSCHQPFPSNRCWLWASHMSARWQEGDGVYWLTTSPKSRSTEGSFTCAYMQPASPGAFAWQAPSTKIMQAKTHCFLKARHRADVVGPQLWMMDLRPWPIAEKKRKCLVSKSTH